MPLLEACVGDFQEAMTKEALGADRVELCFDLAHGGTTPSYGTIKTLVENISIPVMVMIRPRGGNFNFSDQEIAIMKHAIKITRYLGASGIVIGALKNGEIDLEVMKELICEAGYLDTTFHMAFDEVINKFQAIDQLVELGINRILTRGEDQNAIQRLENLKKYITYAEEKIIIMPGKGITRENRDYVARVTGAKELHGTRIV